MLSLRLTTFLSGSAYRTIRVIKLMHMEHDNNMVLLDIDDHSGSARKTSYILEAISDAELELDQINEDIESIKQLKPACDKIDYILAASSGALCGIIDIFLVGKPNESPLGNITDKWFADRTTDFAKRLGWDPRVDTHNNAVTWLEKKFGIPYDQTSIGDAAKQVFGFDTDPSKHHFESLGHNPSLLGLFFSILDQFTNSSHFVIDGQLISLVEADNKFKLQGSNVVSKFFCGIFNWIGHLISDVSGSHGSAIKGNRGMGIPSPLWAWINDIIVIKRKLGFDVSDFDKSMNQIAVEVFNQGFDMRFQATQVIPVVINEIVVRVLYSTRRVISYYQNTPKGDRNFKMLWQSCKPFGNPTISRMLTVAHGTFCLIDIADATARGFISGGGNFNPVEFFLRLNLAGVGRFTIALYGEAKRGIKYYNAKQHAIFAEKKKEIVINYIEGLNKLKELYNDEIYLSFEDDMNNNEYILAFSKSIRLAELRGVDREELLTNKEDIDSYFLNKK